MFTAIPIQDLDPSTSPPSNSTIRAVVTLLWPYSSSTRQCALLLSERDFRLRARGGQIRVTFSGPAARAVAQAKLGISDEVVLELGGGEWASGAAVHVPGKSVGELHFARGVRLRVQKEGTDEVELNIAEDAVDDVEEETSQVEITPAKKSSPKTNFRSSIGTPGSPAIYSSPAYMRKAAKFSYLDGISRLFEDEWNNQDLPRKKARTSIGDVKSWRVVDRTPSPERPSSPAAAAVDEEMTDVVQEALLEAESMVAGEVPMVASVVSQKPDAAMELVRSSPTPGPAQQDIQTTSPTGTSQPLSSPLELLAAEALNGQQFVDTQATTSPSVFPRLSVPPASPSPQPKETEVSEQHIVDPTTPRLLPLSSTALPSTTPQISPLVTKDALPAQTNDDHNEEPDLASQVDLPSGVLSHDRPALSSSPNKATENLLDQLRSTTGQSELATEPVVPDEHEDAVEILSQTEADDLAEEDAFSDDEAEDALSAHEHDDELMPQDDAEDVFEAEEMEAEEPSDDDTNEDPDMYRLAVQEQSEENADGKAHNIEDQPLLQDQMDTNMDNEPPGPTNDRAASQQPGFAPASTLLHAAETPFKSTERTIAAEEDTQVTPQKKPLFGLDGAVSTPGSAEVTTPAAKPTGTPKSTPQSARDKVMKRTFHSLFGIKGTPSPEKEDLAVNDDTADNELDGAQQPGQDVVERMVLPVNGSSNNDAIQSGVSRTEGSIKDDGVESVIAENSSLQNQEEIQEVAESPEPRSVTPVANDSLSDVLTEDQQGDMQTEASLSQRQDSPELIELGSSSDEDDQEEQAENATPIQTPVKTHTSGPMPQKRSAPRAPEPPTSIAPDVELEENLTTLDDTAFVGQPMALDSNLSDAVKQDVQHEFAELVQPMVEDQQEHYGQSPRNAEGSVNERSDAAAPTDMGSRSEQMVLDSFEQPPADPASFVEPAMEVERPASVDIEPLEQIQSDLLHDHTNTVTDDVFMDDGSALQERIKQSQPSVSPEALEARPIEDAPEEPTTGQKDIEDIASMNKNDVEMLDDERQEQKSSQVSFQSQVLHDSMDAQKTGILEHSSRPGSRDTIEEFSPMVLGSMPQRITDLVSEESATARLQELQSMDDVEIEHTPREAQRPPETATLIEEVLLEETPSRNSRIVTDDVEASPLGLHTMSPAKFKSVVQQEQQPTPQESFDDVRQDLAEEEKQDTTAHEILENVEDLTTSDAQLLESQFHATDMVGEQVVQPTKGATLPETSEQIEYPDLKVGEDNSTHLTLPLSPSATQPAEPEVQLSHANIAQSAGHVTSQLHPSVQPHVDLDIAETLRDTANMSQAQPQESEPASMPPPEQTAPPKTPSRKSLRSRLSNVPDVISAWFSPKRSSIVAQEQQATVEVETPAKVEVHATENTRTPKRRASGVSTAHAYFTSLGSLGQHVNASSQQAGTVDVLAIVTDFTKEPERAKGGPRDYYTICRVADTSLPSAESVRVEVYRPWKAVLPAADVGDVILLRSFVVKSKKRQAYLLSTDASAWCVWRFAEHAQATARGATEVRDGEAPAWARRMSHGDVREEVKGPPVEYGAAEKEQARKLRNWWMETHGEAQVNAAEDASGKDREEAIEVIES